MLVKERQLYLYSTSQHLIQSALYILYNEEINVHIPLIKGDFLPIWLFPTQVSDILPYVLIPSRLSMKQNYIHVTNTARKKNLHKAFNLTCHYWLIPSDHVTLTNLGEALKGDRSLTL